jgi:hypothetical protein
VAVAYIAWKYSAEPFFLDKYYPEEEPAANAESLREKIELLEQKKKELELLNTAVDVTSQLLTINTTIEDLKEKLTELEQGVSIDE